MRIAQIVPQSIVDGIGIRLVVFFQGCNHDCKGCHNPSTHDYDGGMFIMPETLSKVILNHLYANPLITGITYSGGEPMDQELELYALTILLKEKRPDLSFMLYTGYTFNELKNNTYSLPLMDYVVDGPYIESQRDISLKFRGSKNQRVYQRIDGEFVDVTDTPEWSAK